MSSEHGHYGHGSDHEGHHHAEVGTNEIFGSMAELSRGPIREALKAMSPRDREAALAQLEAIRSTVLSVGEAGE
jgi:hypothetical protein